MTVTMPAAPAEADVIAAFLDAMAAAGCQPAEGTVVPDGQLHRFDIVGRRRGQRHGWYVLHLDGLPAGAFGDWKEGVDHTWCAKAERRLTAAERAEMRRRMDEARAARQAEQEREHAKAAAAAQRVYEAARPADPAHPYLVRKGVAPSSSLRQDASGRLVVPMRNAGGEIVGVQTIAADGAKLFTKGCAKRAAYSSIGRLGPVIVIAEGYATAASIHAATGHTAVVAFDAGNLLPVAEAIRKKYPDRRIIIAADDDHGTAGNPGLTKARAAAEAVGARVVAPPPGQPGTDFNDLHLAAGLDAVARAFTETADNVVPFPRAEADARGGPDAPSIEPDYSTPYDGPPDDLPDPDDDTASHPQAPLPLGYDHGRYYYLSRADGQIHELTASQHTQMPLMALAPLAGFWERTRFMGKRGVAWIEAADWLMQACRGVGVYRPDRLRGRGAYLDDGRVVLHLGDRALIDGEPTPLREIGGRYIYEASGAIEVDLGAPLAAARARKIVELCDMLPLEASWMSTLLAGWMVVAPVCGALPWRPHLWITGERGSGKTYIMDEIAKPLVGRIALSVQGATTEAGVRQSLGIDARPVFVDEAEGEDEEDRKRIQRVLFLARQASSDEGAPIVKGTTHGEAKAYRIRSVFCFSSINIGVNRAADESRTVVIALAPRDPSPEAAERFEAIRAARDEVATPEFAGALLARTLRALPAIRANADTFARAWVIEGLGSRRQGDTYGALLAGAYSLGSTKPIGMDEARAFLRDRAWVRQAAQATDSDADHDRALQHVLDQIVRHQAGSGAATDWSIADLIVDANAAPAGDAARTLGMHGLRVKDGMLWFAQAHDALNRVFRATPWASAWHRTLLQVPGARKSQPATMHFGKGNTRKAVGVPLSTVIKQEQ